MSGPIAPVAILDIPLDHILDGERLRQVDLAEADKIAVSMKEIGQITPIEVRPNPLRDGHYVLVAGAHRLAAAQRIGWPTIRSVVFEGNGDAARLREIDENLHRHELTPYDQANFLAERREVWERLFGDVKRGGDRRSISKVQVEPLKDAMSRRGFIQNTAESFGISKATVKRGLNRRANIIPELWAYLRRSPDAKNGSMLDRLSRLSVEEQYEVLGTVAERGATIGHAISLLNPGRPANEQPNLTALQRAWEKASPAEKRAFRDFIKAGE